MTELDKKLGELYEARTGSLPVYAVLAVSYIEKIMTGEIKSGFPLPSVKQITQDHFVSRKTAERALHLMEEHGFAEPCSRQPWRAVLPAAAPHRLVDQHSQNCHPAACGSRADSYQRRHDAVADGS